MNSFKIHPFLVSDYTLHPSRSTLADANRVRDFRIFQEPGRLLITQALKLHPGEPLESDNYGAK